MVQLNTEDERNPVPIYTLIDDETPDGACNLLKIAQDSPEGRAYAALARADERLSYMRANFHEKKPHQTVQYSFIEDLEEGKRYLILTKSPEGEGLMKLKRDYDSSRWPAGRTEYDAISDYHKENATLVEDISKPKRSQPKD